METQTGHPRTAPTAAARPILSVCMIVRNEERDLPRCLGSVAGVADDIVVVDTGSADRTTAVAAAHGARVVRHAWRDDFSAARNAALVEAHGSWILVLDADEELDGTAWLGLRHLVEEATWDAARVRMRNLHPAGDLSAFSESRLTRLFRNRPSYRYEGIIHEQIAPAILRAGGTIGDAALTIVHHGYARRTAQEGADRATRNLRLLERALAAAPDDPYLHYQHGAALKMAGAGSEARRALERALRAGAEGLSPEVVDLVHMKLAQLALEDGRFVEAADHARASLAVRPDNVPSLLALGLALLFDGKALAAYPALQRARALVGDETAHSARLDTLLAHCRRQRPGGLSGERGNELPGH